MSIHFSDNNENFKEIFKRIEELKTQSLNTAPVENFETKKEKETDDGGKEKWQQFVMQEIKEREDRWER